jgi:hypothetical protein
LSSEIIFTILHPESWPYAVAKTTYQMLMERKDAWVKPNADIEKKIIDVATKGKGGVKQFTYNTEIGDLTVYFDQIIEIYNTGITDPDVSKVAPPLVSISEKYRAWKQGYDIQRIYVGTWYYVKFRAVFKPSDRIKTIELRSGNITVSPATNDEYTDRFPLATEKILYGVMRVHIVECKGVADIQLTVNGKYPAVLSRSGSEATFDVTDCLVNGLNSVETKITAFPFALWSEKLTFNYTVAVDVFGNTSFSPPSSSTAPPPTEGGGGLPEAPPPPPPPPGGGEKIDVFKFLMEHWKDILGVIVVLVIAVIILYIVAYGAQAFKGLKEVIS